LKWFGVCYFAFKQTQKSVQQLVFEFAA